MPQTVRARSLANPAPYDARFELGERHWNVMLVAQPYDVLAEQLKGLAGIVPTSYSGSSQDPTIEGVRIFRHWVDGLGERIRQADDSHLYYVADGVDPSCGGWAILGPESTTVIPSGAGVTPGGRITKIIEYPGPFTGPKTPRLYAICGYQIIVCNGDPGVGANWSLSKDFGAAFGTPGTPTVTPAWDGPANTVLVLTGGGTTTYTYVVRALGAGGTRSDLAASASVTNTSPLAAGVYDNSISWVSGGSPALNYEVWRTAGGVPGLIYSGPALSMVDDNDAFVITPGAPPAGSINGSSHYEYKIVATVGIAHSVPSPVAGVTDVSAAVPSNGQPNRLTWAPVAGASGYDVWRTAVPGGSPLPLGNLGAVAGDAGSGVLAGTSGTQPPPTPRYQRPTDIHPFVYGTTPLLLVGVDYGFFWYSFDGAPWAGGAVPATHFADLNGFTYRASPNLAAFPGAATDGVSPATEVYKTSTIPTSNASVWAPVDNTRLPITGLLGFSDAMLMASQGELAIAAGEELTPFPTTPDPENGRNLSLFNGQIYARFGDAWGRIALTSATSGTFEDVGMSRFVQNVSGVKGTVRAAAGLNTWFNYFCIADEFGSHLMKLGSWLNPGETNTKRWEFADHLHGAIASWPGRTAASMFISTINGTGTFGSPRLFIGMDDGSFRVITLPRYQPYPKADPNCRYLPTGQLTLGMDDAGFGANGKSYHRAALLGASLSENQSARMAFAIDGSSTFTNFEARFTQNGNSVDFPSSAEGKLLQPQLTLLSTDPTKTPEVTTLLLFAQVREFTDENGNAAFRRRRRVLIAAEDWMIDNEGRSDKLQNARRLRDGLQQIAAASEATLILRDGVRRKIGVLAWSEGMVIGPGGQETYAVTLDYLETALASIPDAHGPQDPGWGP